jgi:hypothetical protein
VSECVSWERETATEMPMGHTPLEASEAAQPGTERRRGGEGCSMADRTKLQRTAFADRPGAYSLAIQTPTLIRHCTHAIAPELQWASCSNLSYNSCSR